MAIIITAKFKDNASQEAKKSFKDVSQAAGQAQNALRKAGNEAELAGKKMEGIGSYARRLKAALAGSGLVLFAKQCFDAALSVDRLDKAFTSITGSAQTAQDQLRFIREVSDKLGLQFQQTAEAAKTFFAAGQGTTIEKELNSIFEGVTSAGAALALSQDQMNGVFLALGQMISKGKVQAEELRGQLGERLPGAFQLAARAMGMTTAELDKAMAKGEVLADDLLPKLGRTLQDEFGAKAIAAADGSQAAVNRLSTAWTDLKATIGDSEDIVLMINNVTNALRILAQYADLRSVSATFAQGMELVKKGLLDFDKFSKAGFMERQRMVDAILNPKYVVHGKLNWEEPVELRKATKSPSSPSDADLAKFKAAEQALQAVYIQIERLKGTGGEFGYEINAKMEEIAKNAKTLGLSLEETNAIQEAYSTAAIDGHFRDIASAMRDVDIEIARMTNDSAALKQLEMERDLDGRRQQLLALGAAQSEVNAKMEAYQEALKNRAEAEDKQLTLRFLKECADLSGNYVHSIELQNLLLEEQARIYGLTLTPQQKALYLEEWKAWKALENSRKAWDGVRLAARDYYADSTNWSKQFEGLTTSVMGNFVDTMTDGLMKGKLSFSDFANSLIRDIMRISLQASTARIMESLLGNTGDKTDWGGIFGKVVGAGVGALGKGGSSSPASAIQNFNPGFGAGLELARGGVIASGLEPWSNTVVAQPTFFDASRQLAAYARGGVFGEAGPEAVMPLTRMSGGELGVKASFGGVRGFSSVREAMDWRPGQDIEKAFAETTRMSMRMLEESRQRMAQERAQAASAPKINLVINNNAPGVDVSQEQRQNSDGSLDIQVMIDQAVARNMARRGSATNNLLRKGFGVNLPPIRR